MSSLSSLKRTPLYDLHVTAGARLVEFGGWEMPVQYQGIVAEHQAVRSEVGMFDVSHMGKVAFKGEGVLESLQRLVPSNLARVAVGQAMYTVLLNEQGGIIDDVILYRHESEGEQEHWSAIINASTTDKDVAWLQSHLDDRLLNYSDTQTLIAVQGQRAIAILQELNESSDRDLRSLPKFGHTTIQLFGKTCFVARTGYTGEDGCEIMADIDTGLNLWQQLLSLGVAPCGLGCRDTLRLEAGMHLYGQDMNEQITPLEADLGWVVHLKEKGEFVGREILEQQKKQGVPQKLVGLSLSGRNIARHDYVIRDRDEAVGIVTSGTMSPTLNRPIAFGYVPPHLAKLGQIVQVQIRGKDFPAQVVKRNFLN
ncbi:MAG: glycine cleavage system aminomethyltransferase GcvT [Pseudanabaenaceae cyanobacterium bins.39]|nr:glycine cleavage system aminomethyltransferase GcvT [Pseudanabaenaceae cyanobacterium bins.39]